MRKNATFPSPTAAVIVILWRWEVCRGKVVSAWNCGIFQPQSQPPSQTPPPTDGGAIIWKFWQKPPPPLTEAITVSVGIPGSVESRGRRRLQRFLRLRFLFSPDSRAGSHLVRFPNPLYDFQLENRTLSHPTHFSKNPGRPSCTFKTEWNVSTNPNVQIRFDAQELISYQVEVARLGSRKNEGGIWGFEDEEGGGGIVVFSWGKALERGKAWTMQNASGEQC